MRGDVTIKKKKKKNNCYLSYTFLLAKQFLPLSLSISLIWNRHYCRFPLFAYRYVYIASAALHPLRIFTIRKPSNNLSLALPPLHYYCMPLSMICNTLVLVFVASFASISVSSFWLIPRCVASYINPTFA